MTSPACAPSAPPSAVEGAAVVESRGGATLYAIAPPAVAPHYPVRSFVLAVGNARWDLGVLYDAALTTAGAAVLAADERLSLVDPGNGCAKPLDADVVPPITVDNAGAQIVYERRHGERSSLHLLRVPEASPGSPPASRELTPGLQHANRPLLLERGGLLFVGSEPGAMPGLYRLMSLDAPVVEQLTNVGMKLGRGRPAGFVPVPVDRASMEVVGTTLRYDDGEKLRTMDLETRNVVDMAPSPRGGAR